MSPEVSVPNYERPELETASSAEAMQSDEQVTLQNLLAVIHHKAKDGIGESGAGIVHLHAPDGGTGTATVREVPVNPNLSSRMVVGNIEYLDDDKNTGVKIGRSYLLFRGAYGLELEKTEKDYSGPISYAKILEIPSETKKLVALASSILLADRKAKAAEVAQKPMNVKGQEAQYLLTWLTNLVPFDRPKPSRMSKKY